MVEREGARDRQHRRRAREEPGESDVSSGGVAPLGDFGKRGTAIAAERKVGNEHDPFASAVVDDIVVLALGEAVVVLHRGNGDDPTSPLDLLDTNVGEPDVPNLPLSRCSLIAPMLCSSGVAGSRRCK